MFTARATACIARGWIAGRSFTDPLRRVADALNPKHLATLRLEQSLFGAGGARRVIANSHMVKARDRRIYGYPATHIDLVHNGVPVEQFRSSARADATTTRAALGLARRRHRGAVCRLRLGAQRSALRDRRQSKPQRDPHLRLLVAGKGNEARYRSPACSFLGVADDLPALYAAGDIFLLPTIYDPFSNASLEALAAGLPVITTRANGFAEIMRRRRSRQRHRAAGRCARRSPLRCDSGPMPERRARSARAVDSNSRATTTSAINVERTLEILLQAAASAASTSGINPEDLIEPRDLEDRPHAFLQTGERELAAVAGRRSASLRSAPPGRSYRCS